IGLELGSVWSRLGAEVVILEALDELLPAADRDIAKEAEKQFRRQGAPIPSGAKSTGAVPTDQGVGVEDPGRRGAPTAGGGPPGGPGPPIHGGAKAAGARRTARGVVVESSGRAGAQTPEVDRLAVAVGRRPYTAGLLAEDCGIRLDERGFIPVDDGCRTRVKGVYAIGDCVRGPMLAHKASEEGVMAADLIAGEVAEVNYAVVPSVIYTAPEIAWVGKTEREVQESGRAYKTGSFPFVANGRAKALEQTAGMVKVVSAADDDEILGVHILGPMAGELIAEAVLAMEFSASTEDLQRTIHAHPTLAEALHEASLAADKRALNYPN